MDKKGAFIIFLIFIIIGAFLFIFSGLIKTDTDYYTAKVVGYTYTEDYADRYTLLVKVPEISKDEIYICELDEVVNTKDKYPKGSTISVICIDGKDSIRFKLCESAVEGYNNSKELRIFGVLCFATAVLILIWSLVIPSVRGY